MFFYTHPTKKAKLDWLYWFYDGKYSKAEIKRRNYVSWYFKLRYSGACKPKKPMVLVAK